MDPLGARPTITTADGISRWSQENVEQKIRDPLSPGPSLFGPDSDLPKAHTSPPFETRKDLNEKVALW